MHDSIPVVEQAVQQLHLQGPAPQFSVCHGNSSAFVSDLGYGEAFQIDLLFRRLPLGIHSL